jgi:ribosomal protein L12E/L44/L45/RPP1/RPP2
MTTQKTNPWTFDVRVRERNLKAGSVTDKDVEKYLAGLPDLADQSEAFATAAQPALAPPPPPPPPPAALDDSDDEEDEEEDEDEDDGEVAEASEDSSIAPV